MLDTSIPSGSYTPDRGRRLRAMKRLNRKLRFLAVLLTFLAMRPGVDVKADPADLAPAPASAIAAASLVPAPVLDPAPKAPAPAAPRATPAVFQKDVQGLSPQVLSAALDAVSCARARGIAGSEDLLTIIDYSLPSTEERLWVLDLERGEVLYHELVAHGAGTGDNYATRFSNVKDSRQTSLGLFLTGGTYEGGNGYSLKLRGLDEGINDRAEERHIVMHGAWYVSPEHARGHGRLGRSWGCPALSEKIAPRVIDTIKGGSFVYSYAASDPTFRTASTRSCGAAGPQTVQAAAR